MSARRRSSSIATQTGAIHAFVNRCAHRGALVRRELSGNATEHICIYHQWCYGLDGRLNAIPFRRGIRGKGGLEPGFDMAAHGLRRLQVGAVNGALFGTLADDAEPLEEYLGAPVLAQLRRLFDRPVQVLGYNRQRIRGNWKIYAENTRDNYHASLLHEFLVTFGLDRSTQVGGVTMDARHRHNITWAEAGSDTEEIAPAGLWRRPGPQQLSVACRSRRWSRSAPSTPTGSTSRSPRCFPARVFVQISNSLAVRQIRPRGVDEVEMFQTMFGYDDDPPEMMLHRLRQANLVGPAGLVSMEDGEAIEIAPPRLRPDGDRATVIELGGGGVISDRDYRVTTCRCAASGRITPNCWGSSPPARCDDRLDRLGALRSVCRIRRADRRGGIRRLARPIRRRMPLSASCRARITSWGCRRG